MNTYKLRAEQLNEDEWELKRERKAANGPDPELDEWAHELQLERAKQEEWGAKVRTGFLGLDAQPGDLVGYTLVPDPHFDYSLPRHVILDRADADAIWGEQTDPYTLRQPGTTAPEILTREPEVLLWANVNKVWIASRQPSTITTREHQRERERQRQRERQQAAERAMREAAVEAEVRRRSIIEEAKRRMRDSRAEEMPEGLTLATFLDRDLNEESYTIEGLLPTGGNVLLSAAAKSGKTTMTHNLIRSLVDGDPFLGNFAVNRNRTVGLLDFELSPKMMQTWLGEHDIEHTDRVKVFSMRGHTASFDILDPARRSEWADLLRGVDVLILDPLLPVLAALGLDHNSEAGSFLAAFDALKAEAGISEGIIVHHYGHGAQRATGDSRLLGWPDALWDVSWDDPEDFSSLRLFHARGRDVDISKTPMRLDGRRLTLDGTVSTARQDIQLEKVLAFLRAHPDSDRNAILAAGLRGVNSSSFHAVTREAIEDGRIAVRIEGRGRKLYSVGTTSAD